MLKIIARKALAHTNSEIFKSILRSQEEKNLIKSRRKFYLQFLKAGDLYFDVGSNYGNRIEPIINDGIRIVAVEPQLKCLKQLKRQFGDKITLVPCGLGAEKGMQTMYISDANVLTSFSKEWIESAKESGRFGTYQWNDHREVEIKTLDELIDSYGVPQFIKIDVEGFEYQVISGLSQPVDMLSFEYAIPEQKASIIDCILKISELGKERKVRFNYSVSESMQWALEEWLTVDQMLEEVNSVKFLKTDFGDIYARSTMK